MPKTINTAGRVIAIFSLLLITLIVGIVITSYLPSPPGRYIFTPANEVGAGALLLLVSWALSVWRWPRWNDLVLSLVVFQVVIVLIVGYFTEFPSISLWWVLHVSRFITPPIGIGMILGLKTRKIRRPIKRSSGRRGRRSVKSWSRRFRRRLR